MTCERMCFVSVPRPLTAATNYCSGYNGYDCFVVTALRLHPGNLVRLVLLPHLTLFRTIPFRNIE